jgi:four helix bundle protein
MKQTQYNLEDRLVDFAVMVIDAAEQVPDTRAGNHIGGQLIRSGTSPAPNYGEAQGAESRNDFIHKMKVAFKELRETRVWLRVMLRKSFHIERKRVELVLDECEQLIRIFGKAIATADSKQARIGSRSQDGSR